MVRLVAGFGLGLVVAFCCGVGSAAETVGVAGRVVDFRTGAGLARTDVEIVDGSSQVVRVVTDRGGRFRAIGLVDGKLTVGVERRGYQSQRAECHVPSGETLQLDFALRSPISKIQGAPSRCALQPQSSDRYIIQ